MAKIIINNNIIYYFRNMKKIAMFIAAAAVAVSASAQKTALTGNKATDGIYVGVNAGAETNKSFERYAPTFGVRVGKNITPIFGLAIDAQTSFNTHKADCLSSNGNTFRKMDIDLLGTVNLNNLFAGYKGEPRFFEVVALYGFGWQHTFYPGKDFNGINSKAAVDFAFNLGAKKAWQVYVEPSVTFNMNKQNVWGVAAIYAAQDVAANDFKYSINRADFGLKAGVNYKFACSNGKNNFAIEALRDQAEIDALNAKINDAKAEAEAAKVAAAAKDAEIAKLKKALKDCENKPAPVVEKKAANLQPSVVFGQGKSAVEKSQLANIQMIANYMKANKDAKVKISGYASPEGNAELNQKLSEKRAEAVKEVLVKKYKIAADRLEAEGLGATDKLFDEVEFNRVALFNDTTK